MNDSIHADLVLKSTAVYTVDAAGRWAEALAVRGGRIVAVGTDADIESLVGPRTEVLELEGRMVLPGFQDAHSHPPAGGLDRMRCELHEAGGRGEYEEVIRSYAGSHPEAEWIMGGGWAMSHFPGGTPTKEELDRLVSDRPVYLQNRDGHGAWVNSRALEMAGITRDTPDPADGRIERDERGEPSGTLHEGAMSIVEDLAPPITEEDLAEALRIAQKYLLSLGVTAWQDAIVGGESWAETLDVYRAAAERGHLKARVVGALWWDRHGGEEQVEEFVERRARGSHGRFQATSIKIMQDGVVENFTAGVLEPYLGADGRPTDNRGLGFVEAEALKRYVTLLDAAGFQVHFHAIGERAVRESLDACEVALRENGPNDHRHHIAHIQVIHPDDVPRFRKLGVVANGQPLWACHEPQMDDLTIPFLGPERSTWQYPFRSLVRSGAVLAFGSDWPVSTPDPIEEIHVAVNRVAAPGYAYGTGEELESLLPAERIDLPTAIRAFTMGSAYVNHLDGDTGSIEPGKYADLTVLDRNLFADDPSRIHEARVLLTLVEGERVHAAGQLK